MFDFLQKKYEKKIKKWMGKVSKFDLTWNDPAVVSLNCKNTTTHLLLITSEIIFSCHLRYRVQVKQLWDLHWWLILLFLCLFPCRLFVRTSPRLRLRPSWVNCCSSMTWRPSVPEGQKNETGTKTLKWKQNTDHLRSVTPGLNPLSSDVVM